MSACDSSAANGGEEGGNIPSKLRQRQKMEERVSHKSTNDILAMKWLLNVLFLFLFNFFGYVRMYFYSFWKPVSNK